MTRRWGLQSAMTATYVAVTAGAVLLTELVIFGMAALSPQAPLTPVQVQGLAEATAATDGGEARRHRDRRRLAAEHAYRPAGRAGDAQARRGRTAAAA